MALMHFSLQLSSIKHILTFVNTTSWKIQDIINIIMNHDSHEW
jgi:hypothetical protein